MLILLDSYTRELFIHGKAMVPYVQLSTNCGLNNFITVQILLSLYQKPILQLVDNYTYGTLSFPCIKSTLVTLSAYTIIYNASKKFKTNFKIDLFPFL